MSRVEFMLMMIYVKYIKLEYFVIYLKIKKKRYGLIIIKTKKTKTSTTMTMTPNKTKIGYKCFKLKITNLIITFV